MVKTILVMAFMALFALASSTRRYYPNIPRTPRHRHFLCSANETWAPCPEAVCSPKTCDDVGFPIPCYDLGPNGTCPSKPCCICKEGFVRNYRGVCIPIEFCPSCGGDGNAMPGCGNCNKLCSNYDKSDVSCIEECFYNACDCKKGFVFDEITRKCVRPNRCSPPIQCKKRNEVYDPCPSSCPYRTCGINDAAVSCVPALPYGHPDCPPPACRCKDGYYRNHLGNCVLWKNCPRCKRPNEVYDPCPAPCPARTCDDNEALILCQVPPQLGDPECKPACRCTDGYVRNQSGICIPKEECPTSCNGDPNAVTGCGVYCNQRCRDIGKKPQACILICYPDSCDCRKGYFLDENTGKCVLPQQCSPQCPINEVFSNCVQGDCRPQKCSQLGFPVPCPRIDPKFCKKGCLCKEGYVRNKKGVCIPKSECPSCGSDSNKIAGCGVYCNQKCSNIGKKPEGCIEICYDNACDCREGYFLDEYTGFCVLPKQCPPQCPKNEVYNNCIQGNCSPQNCSQLGFSVPCPRIDPRFCKKGCLCIEGYVRNKKGVCIPKTECPSCGGDPNKRAGCGVYCNQKCSDIGKEPGACIKICNDNACDCREGYYLDENTGFCVLPKQCQPECPLNEVYSNCIQGNCSPQNCSQLGFPIPCPKINPKFCKKGCVCKEGYVRNDKGVCIPTSECLSCGGDINQRAGCGVYCNQRCRNIENESDICITICNVNACDCREGYYLDENTGFCVLPKQCTPQCPPNEWYSECTQGNCSPENCTQVGFPIACPLIDENYCKKGCLCKEGYARNKKGVCIPSKKCPSCGGDPNAEAGCGGNCNKHCSDIGKEPGACILICQLNGCNCKEGYYYDDKTKRCVKPEQCSSSSPQCGANEEYDKCVNAYCGAQTCDDLGFPIACASVEPEYCRGGCRCKSEYVRNYDGICVPSDECPSSCPINEVPSDCINGGCQARNCSQYGKPIPCIKIDPKYCQKGCVCRDSYLRASHGLCVPENDCPAACNGPNEQFNECSFNCPPQTCESLDMAYVCPIREGDICKPMCNCKPGYFRNKIGQCITEEQCRRCMDPHEFYSCGGACDNVCKTLEQQSQDNCSIINIKCNEMCYCERGYARSNNNTCIPISYCESDNGYCNEDEIYEDCSNSVCNAEYCSDLGFPLNCKSKCRKGCICKDGYVRDNTDKCIPIQNCPSCRGDPNAQSGCGVNCLKRCSDLVGKITPCKRICYPNSCDCREGFYYDSIQEKCVPAGQCTNICEKNEVFEDCSNPTSRAKNCSQVGFPLDSNETCVKGCVCQNGYVRDENGICIPIYQCSSCGGDSNAQSGCGTNCGRRCPNNYINQKLCPRIACVPQLNKCDCKDGFYYDINTNSCVEFEDCSPSCNASNNEVYDSCVNGGCGWRNCSQVGGPILCIDPISCKKGCKCKDGYYRLDNGTCVTEDMCPYTKCKGPHEYLFCGHECDNVCGKLDTESKNNCPIINKKCVPKCYCEDDYARNDSGICIPIDQCPEHCESTGKSSDEDSYENS